MKELSVLEDIFEIQKEFQKNFVELESMTFSERVFLSKDFILSAHAELSEVLNTLPWKTHVDYKGRTIDINELREELIDTIKFILNIYILWGIGPKDLVYDFYAKSKKVQRRYDKQKIRSKSHK